MGSMGNPFAELKTAWNGPPPLQQYAEAMNIANQMQNAPIQHQLLQGQLTTQAQQQQTQQQAIQEQQQNMAARQALNAAYSGAVTKDADGNPTIDTNKLASGLANTPAAYQTPAVMKNIADFHKSLLGLQLATADLHTKTSDMIGSAGSAVKAAGYDPALAQSLLDSLPPSPQRDAMLAQAGNPATLKQMVDSAIANSPAQQKLSNAQSVAQIRANTPEAQQMNAWLAQQKAQGVNATPADWAQHKVDMQTQGVVSRETNPQVIQARVQAAQAEGQARADVEAQIARGSNAALATVPPHLVGPATAAATKAGEDYAQAQSVTQRLQEMMDAARSGNVVSYKLLPEEGALQVMTSQGVHRINMAEIQNYGGGSLWQDMQGHFGKALSGQSIPPSVLSDMAQMQAIQQRGAQSKYENSLNQINQMYGAKFQPLNIGTASSPVSVTAPNGKVYQFKNAAAAAAFKKTAGIQ